MALDKRQFGFPPSGLAQPTCAMFVFLLRVRRGSDSGWFSQSEWFGILLGARGSDVQLLFSSLRCAVFGFLHWVFTIRYWYSQQHTASLLVVLIVPGLSRLRCAVFGLRVRRGSVS